MAVVLDLNTPRPRHPEKAHRPDSASPKKPDWIRVKAPVSAGYNETHAIMRANGLHTVCEEAGCPNIGECWEKKHATFMIMGDTCTRACAFCNVKTGLPGALDPNEPAHVGEATAKLGLAHIVVTSVDRDDLADGGAQHFADTIGAIRARCPRTTIEVLTPDFLRKDGALEIVVAAKPDVFNHNLETVPSLYLTVRPGARYFHSLRLLQRVKEIDPHDVHQVGDHGGPGRRAQRSAAGDGRPAFGQCRLPHHRAISAADPQASRGVRFVPPDEFEALKTIAYAKGFLMVAASPLTRSSHHAGEDFARLKAARASHPLRHAAIFHEAPRPPLRVGHVRPGRRHGEISGLRAAVQCAARCAAAPRRARASAS